MIEFVSRNGNKNLILFVHGFTGGKETWDSQQGHSFPDLLLEDQNIAERYDVAHFLYYTKLLNLFSKASNAAKIIRKIFKKSHGKLQSNSSIDEVSNLLRSEIRFQLESYENIVIIAHSMGGLVSKSCIIKDIHESVPSKIKLFLSLAVPHMGADLATYGSLISSNLQMGDLKPLNTFIHDINDSWLKTSIRPEAKYFYGIDDSVVSKTSAAPIDKEISDIIPVEENHTSITKPEGSENTTVVAVKSLIMAYQSGDPGVSHLKHQTLIDEDEYNDEIFVLKLISADIHKVSVVDAKEVFLNAEYIRKIFRSDSDQKRLDELYTKIRKIYSISYSKYIHDGIPNSGLLLADVHEQILKEDKAFLDTLIPFISAIHKQGMLHQLANSTSDNIWWSKESKLSSLIASQKD